MNLRRTQNPARRAMRARALTMVELLVAMAVFSLVVIGTVYTEMSGLLQDQLVNSKLGASDGSRRGFNQLSAEIRSAKMWRIGTGTTNSFTPVPNGTLQQANALQVYPTTDTNSYIRYFFDTNHYRLCRLVTGSPDCSVVVESLTNTMCFRAEDHLGNPKTDLSYKYVIRVMMEFSQYQYPLTRVGAGYYYDYYKMEFRITPHCPDGA